MDGLSFTYHLLNCIILFPGGWVPRDTAYARAKARYLPQVEINSVLVVYACRRGIAAWIQGLWEKKRREIWVVCVLGEHEQGKHEL